MHVCEEKTLSNTEERIEYIFSGKTKQPINMQLFLFIYL